MPSIPLGKLFVRVWLVQLGLAVTVVLILLGLFYTERTRNLAQLVAERWAPLLRVVPVSGRELTPWPSGLSWSVIPPDGARRWGVDAVRLVALREAFEEEGVPVADLALDSHTRPSTLWLALPDAPGEGAPTVWVGFQEPMVENHFSLRVIAAIVMLLIATGASSAWLARWLVRPLETLRAHLQSYRPGGMEPARTPQLTGASEEVLAIASAWEGLTQRLAQHERERALMLAGVSHDLRSPLSRIKLAASLMPETAELEPRRLLIERNVQQADRLLESFLDHARLAAVPLDQTVDAKALVRQVAGQRGGMERDGRAPVRVELPAQDVLLERTHPMLLERLLSNLVDNALIHGCPPVQVRLSVPQRGRFRLEVWDAGAGIPSHLQAQAQQAFYRGDPARHAPGSGLGLAIVRDCVARLGATLTFEGGAGAFCVRVEGPQTVVDAADAARPPQP
jgi:two-component system, OmpR family, osmolarity sensor histidine kinase EnvZ